MRNYLTAAMLIATAYFAFSPEAQARDVTCGDVKAILAQTPGVTPVDAEAGGVAADSLAPSLLTVVRVSF